MALAKCASLEKSKCRLQCDVEELMVDVEKANASAASMEKKQKVFDRLVGEWRQRCEALTLELEAAQKEARALAAECVTLRAQGQEGAEASEAVRRENGHLAEEVRDLLEQVGSGGRSVHELERVARRLAVEREEVQVALEEAERALEQCEAKCSLSQLECSNVR
jgi:chromosome segregation ATPase